MRRILLTIFPSSPRLPVVKHQELTAMKNAYELLYRKEEELARVREEIESLKVVAPLLAQERLKSLPFRPGNRN